MKEVIHQYGSAIIAAVAAALIMGLLLIHFSNKSDAGVLKLLNDSNLLTESIEEEKSLRSATGVMLMDSPEITVPTMLRRDTSYNVVDTFSDAAGKNLNVRILRVWDEAENDITDDVLIDDDMIFPQAGIYYLRIWVEDENGASSTEELYMGINE